MFSYSFPARLVHYFQLCSFAVSFPAWTICSECFGLVSGTVGALFSPFLFDLVSNCPTVSLSALVDFCLGPATAPGTLVGSRYCCSLENMYRLEFVLVSQ